MDDIQFAVTPEGRAAIKQYAGIDPVDHGLVERGRYDADPEDIVVCMPTSAGPAIAAKSTREQCELCGTDVWLSVNSPRNCHRYCVRCAVEQLNHAAR